MSVSMQGMGKTIQTGSDSIQRWNPMDVMMPKQPGAP
jgi:hypothetical protein